MPRKPKTEVPGIWVNPNSTLSRGHIAWDRRKRDAVSARYLDLAEIALRKQLIECKSPETYLQLPTISPMKIPGTPIR